MKWLFKYKIHLSDPGHYKKNHFFIKIVDTIDQKYIVDWKNVFSLTFKNCSDWKLVGLFLKCNQSSIDKMVYGNRLIPSRHV